MPSFPLIPPDDHVHDVCGVALHAINQQNPDILKRHATLALPLAFLAMHRKVDTEGDDDGKTSVWEEVWLDATPGEWSREFIKSSQ